MRHPCTADVSNRKRSEAEVLSELSKCQSSQKECSTNHQDSEQKLNSCTRQNSDFRQMVKDLSSQHTSATNALLQKLATAEADAKVVNQRLLECRSQLSTASSEGAARGVALSQKQKQIDSLQYALTTTNAQMGFIRSQIASRVKHQYKQSRRSPSLNLMLARTQLRLLKCPTPLRSTRQAIPNISKSWTKSTTALH
jgi:chromosome segregation ATPase